MKKFFALLTLCVWGGVVQAAEMKAQALDLTNEQNQQLAVMQEQLKAEVQPIWEEIESSRNRIIEIEKKYFEAFWNILSDEQKEIFSKLNQGK